jgi:protein involved in polysaccharide export with SLBB domain/uncharacterized protein involved in exopolysaccharide biosynthesis
VVLDLLLRRWHWLVLGSVLFAGGFFLLGREVVKPKFTASAKLLRYELPGADILKTGTPISPETFAGMLRAPELLRRVGEQLVPPVGPERLAKALKVEPEPDSDIMTIILVGRSPQEAVEVLDRYLRETVDYTKELQAQAAGRMANDYLQKQLAQMDKDLAIVERQLRAMPSSPEMSAMTNKLTEIGTNLNTLNATLANSQRPTLLLTKQTELLATKLADLNELNSKYTAIHPLVLAKTQEIDDLQKQINQASTNRNPAFQAMAPVIGAAGPNILNPDFDIMQIRLRALADSRLDLAKRYREAQLYADNPPGVARVLAPASLSTVKTNLRDLKIALVAIFGGLLGIGASLGLVTLVEVTDRRLRTSDDVERVTNLPVLAALGNLRRMKPAARAQWAFRAWTMLQGRLSPTANHGLICGFTSSTPGEGRSTWISLLAEAASLTGFRVLTIATRPSPTHVESAADDPNDPLPVEPEAEAPGENAGALTTNVLTSPAQVTDQLLGSDSQPVVHIPLPGWVWNLERRKQWREAISEWRKVDNLVILVELPPASVTEAVLLGSNLPNIVWLAEGGHADAAETRAQLETLRDARCNLVGAVLNREDSPTIRKRFPRWMDCFVLVAALSLSKAWAQDSGTGVSPATAGVPPALASKNEQSPQADGTPTTLAQAGPATEPQPARFFSVVDPSQRAEWQRHLTLGPGDVLTLGMFGEPDLVRADVAVGPDGRVNFLEATNVLATGLTIDEFRGALDKSLGAYRRAPRSLVTPVAFRSKRYYMLGKVMVKGVYTLDRPLTVLEAVARAKGIENGLVDRNIVDLADYSHSFLARGGKRFPLNFEKLFLQGDLSQNIPIEPGDYIYFASGSVQEAYVVGEVRLPGAVTFIPNMSIIHAITARGGYTDRAFRARVLVVRGSLNAPETFVVNTHAILDAKAPDFALQPRDIIYVNSRPFIKVEELADLAATAFIQSLITEWVGVNVIKPIP